MTLRDDLTLGQKIRQLRLEKHLSQSQLAEGICHVTAISQLERDKFNPRPDLLFQLAQRLGVAVESLVELQSIPVEFVLDMISVYLEKRSLDKAADLIEDLEIRSLDRLEKVQVKLLRSELLRQEKKYDQVLSLLESLLLSDITILDDRMLAVIYNRMGTVHFALNNIVKAYANYQKAFEYTHRLPAGDFVTAKIHFNLARVSGWFGFADDSLVHLEIATDIYKAANKTDALADAYFALGIEYKNKRDYANASVHLKNAIALYRAHELVEMELRARQEYACNIRRLTDLDGAEVELLEIAERYAEKGDTIFEVYTVARLCYMLLDSPRRYDAKLYMDRLDKLDLEENNPIVAFILRVKARLFLLIGDVENAIFTAEKSAEKFGRLALRREQGKSMRVVADALMAAGRYKEAAELSTRILDIYQERKVDVI